MPDTAGRPAVLVISNGHGEDSIAASIVARFPDTGAAKAYPVIGEGRAFEGVCPIVGPRSHIPSQGSRIRRGSLLRDLPAMLAGLAPALSFLRGERGRNDCVLVVGDLSAIVLCAIADLPVSLYLDVYRYGQAYGYARPELWALKKTGARVFCRDDILASRLRAAGIDAASHGNVMIDTIPYAGYDTAARRAHGLCIGLLPGSRAGTPQALALQIAALDIAGLAGDVDLFAALAPGIDPQALATATGLSYRPATTADPADCGRLEGRELIVHLAAAATGNVLEAADFALSQAGTATQQALGLGKPVIAFSEPENRRHRMEKEQALMGEARILVAHDAHAMAAEIARLASDSAERARLGAIGRERVGGPGTMDAVLDAVFGPTRPPDRAADADVR